MVDSSVLLEQCAPHISARLMHALVRVESGWRPLAIGMDAREGTVRQPQTKKQAVEQAELLSAAGRGFSVGLAQIHVGNVKRYGISWEQAFDPCLNLEAGQRVLQDFYRDAWAAGYVGLAATHAALRGYNAGTIDRAANSSYARRVVALAQGGPSAMQAKAQELAFESPTPVHAGSQSQASGSHAEPSASATRQGEAMDIFTKRSTVPGF